MLNTFNTFQAEVDEKKTVDKVPQCISYAEYKYNMKQLKHEMNNEKREALLKQEEYYMQIIAHKEQVWQQEKRLLIAQLKACKNDQKNE
jgi:hypothetical protein